MRHAASVLLALGLLLPPGPAAADVPATMTFQGHLASAGGDPINGPVDILFRLYDQSSGGTPLWQESHSGVVVSNGLFTVVLGSQQPLLPDLFGGPERYLGVTVDGGDEMTPRQAIAAVPYALEAYHASDSDNAALLDGHPASYFATADHEHPPEASVGVDFSQKDEATTLLTSATEVTAVEISAPAAGWVQVVMQGQFNAQILFGSNTVNCQASISTDGSMNPDEQVSWSSSTNGTSESFSRFALIQVAEGDTTFHFVGKANVSSAIASCTVTKAVITAMFVPNRY